MKEVASYTVLNSTEYVDIAGIHKIPAKIDTGAYSSAIWASDIKIQPDGVLSFILFGPSSPLYSGKRITMSEYTAKRVRSSHGDQQVRYQVEMDITLGGQSFKTVFNLSNRSRNYFPVLIGRLALKNRFLVDASKTAVIREKKPIVSNLKQELKEDPHKFHQKYIERSK